eukprot:TRINITY_DN2819_c0_g3_i2.p1 TRINITY_DN2819_c0_g3~~TRINITY_DN2819_c0_g3_i2.p1  ORF type:complete len:220 (+),score=6.26 TRINITY_DN2819_c0_g3_i2:48-662(+)
MAGVVLHVRNIPCKILETELRDVMREFGLDVSRYVLYVPKKPGRQGRYNNFGYGFVTCSDAEAAQLFTRTLQGYHFENIASCKRLVIEPGHGNTAVGPRCSAFGQSGSPDAWHTVTPSNSDWWSTNSSYTVSPTSSGSTDVVGHHGMYAAAQHGRRECWAVPGFEGPDVSKVPPTRLAVDEPHSVADPADTLLSDSSRMCFRFQ